MITFVPTYLYETLFNYLVLFLVGFIFLQCCLGVSLKKEVASLSSGLGVVLAIALIVYIGLRPMSDYFGDTMNYYHRFLDFKINKEFDYTYEGEWMFYDNMRWFAQNSTIYMFFLSCAIIYVGSLWLACVRIFKSYNFIPFVIFLCMFTFWAYGVNGVRNGMAASLFILAITYIDKLPIAILLCVIGYFFHHSILMMVGAAGIAWFLKNSYVYLSVWILCVIASYFYGDTIQEYLSTISYFQEDDRFSGYLTGSNMAGEIVQYAMTFRWDFLAYSAIGVAVGYYFIFIRKFQDEYYHWIFNIYVTTNAFWVLIIRAAYSNRFAQISWFILPLVLIYPFMKKRFWENHEMMLGYAILIFYAFAFYTNVLTTLL